MHAQIPTHTHSRKEREIQRERENAVKAHRKAGKTVVICHSYGALFSISLSYHCHMLKNYKYIIFSGYQEPIKGERLTLFGTSITSEH